MKKHTIFVGLDVHKDSVDVAFAGLSAEGKVTAIAASPIAEERKLGSQR